MARMPLGRVALALGLTGTVIFTLCILWDLALPSLAMTRFWELALPGFQGISAASYALGVVETFIGGVAVAAVFVPIWNGLRPKAA